MRPRIVFLASMSMLLAVGSFSADAADIRPMSEEIAERILSQRAVVVSELERLLESRGTAATTRVASFIDNETTPWRMYYRDRQLLLAVPTTRNVSAVEKLEGETELRELAVVLLQQRFSKLLQFEGNIGLDPSSVRVVFIEPAAYGFGRSSGIPVFGNAQHTAGRLPAACYGGPGVLAPNTMSIRHNGTCP
jgi:hypothetical protein